MCWRTYVLDTTNADACNDHDSSLRGDQLLAQEMDQVMLGFSHPL